MKKQKFMKLTAFASAPSMENSFSAPETHNGEISIVFSGKNVKIHGWDGSAWSVIYTWNSADKQFTFDNTYQNYFLESLTGGNETISVSFFSVNRYQGSTPALAGVNREVKLYDIEEVPIYTPSDVGKMLTIMSDGSLRWLDASATWMIDGSPVPSGNSYSETIVLDGNGQTFVRANRDVLNLGDDPSYDRVDGEDFAVEGEFKLASTYGSATWDIIGKGQTSGWWGWAVMIYGGVIRMFAHSSGTAVSGHGMNATFSPVVGQWYHFKAIWKNDGKQEMWVDGVKLAERTVTSSGYFPPVDTAYDLQIGEVFTNSVRNFDGDIRNVKIQSGTIN